MKSALSFLSTAWLLLDVAAAQATPDYSFLYVFSAHQADETLRIQMRERDIAAPAFGEFSALSVPAGEQQLVISREGRSPLRVSGLIPSERSGCLFLFPGDDGDLAARFLVVEAAPDRAQLTTLSFTSSSGLVVREGEKEILPIRPLAPQSSTVDYGKTLNVALAGGQSEEFSIARGIHYVLIAYLHDGSERVTIIPVQRRKVALPASKPPW